MPDEIEDHSAVDPRLQIGANFPPLTQQIGQIQDFAATVTSSLMQEHRELARSVDDVLDEARVLTGGVHTPEDVSLYAAMIKRLKDTASKIEKIRVSAVEPFLRGQQATNAYCFGLHDRLARRPGQKSARPGEADRLQGELDAYQQRKLAEERAERDRKAAEERRLAAIAQAERDRLAREAREAEQRALRARTEATQAARREEAAQAAQAASVAASASEQATEAARSSHVDSLARPADMVRTRTDSGATVTMAREAYAKIVDRELLDKEKLWPFLKDEHIAMALRAWAKTGNHAVEMPGALVGHRQKTVVR